MACDEPAEGGEDERGAEGTWCGMRQRLTGRRIVLAILGLLACSFLLYCWRAMQPEVGRNVALNQCPIPGLPSSAANISYLRHGAFGPADAYEFDVPEAEFLSWAKGKGWNLVPATSTAQGTPWSIRRYGAEVFSRDAAPGDPQKAEIVNGYAYETTPNLNGAVLMVGYDSSQHRAYFYRSFR